MHTIEPFYRWQNLYDASKDRNSPFFGREYSEYECQYTIYNYYIHPQWDYFGSDTLYLKILYVDYKKGYAIIELLGEWNDCLYNDIMFLKENVINPLIRKKINKFILIGEYVFNFHYSDDLYYQEWVEEIENGWIAAINFRQHVIQEFKQIALHRLLQFIPSANYFLNWRKFSPDGLFQTIQKILEFQLKAPSDIDPADENFLPQPEDTLDF